MHTHKIIIRVLYLWILLSATLYGYCLPNNRPFYTISGSTSVEEQNVMPYSCAGSLTNGAYWEAVNGTIVYSDVDRAYVEWGTMGNGELRIKEANGQVSASLAITINLGFGTYTVNPSWQVIEPNTLPGILSPDNIPDINCTWQWQQSADGINYSDVPGATTRNWQPPALTTTTFFRRRQRCGSGPLVLPTYSLNSVVIVRALLQGGSITPASQNIARGSIPAPLTLQGVTGGTGSRNYDWQYSIDLTNWNSLNNNSLQFAPVQLVTTTYYKVIVSTATETATSNLAVVHVDPVLNGGTVSPASITIGVGASPGTITATSATGGVCSSYSYQWQQSPDNVNFTDIPGAVAQNYTPGNLTASTYFRRKVTCNTALAYSTSCQVIVSAGNVENVNYIRTRIFDIPVTDPALAELLVRPGSVKQTTQYLDGLGRLMQTVSRQSSPAVKDIVIPSVYDNMGRPAIGYLPYVAATGDGAFKSNALNEQNNFNAGQFPGEQFYYSQVNYETSPIGRVTRAMAPGSNWVGSNRGISHQYDFNGPGDNIYKWTVTDATNDWGQYNTSGFYTAGELYKMTTVDEDGKSVIEYKDRMGNLVWKKVQVGDQPSPDPYAGWLCTLYLYDVMNNLRLVVQPRGVELLIQNGFVLNNTILNNQCFRYEYDQRNLVIRKKAPGAGEIAMVYDKLHRLVMTQDALQRTAGKWLITLYDVYDRPVETGSWSGSGDVFAHNNTASASNAYPFAINAIPGTGYEMLSQTGYDNYNTIPSGSGLTTTLDNTGFNNLITPYNTAPLYMEEVIASQQVMDLVTWTKTKVLGSSPVTYLVTVNLYDNKERLIQVKSTNITNGVDILTTQYTWSGRPMITILKQQYAGGSNPQMHIVVSRMDYDDMGRLLSVMKSVSSDINGVTVLKSANFISKNEYDALGQLKTKAIGQKKDASGNYTNDPLESLTYDYNVRGWLLGMNRDYLSGTVTDRHFGFELGYDKNTSSAGRNFNARLYNGSITGMLWKSAGDGIQRKYDYKYDGVNRLLRADFEQHNQDGSWNSNLVNFSVKMGDGSTPTDAYDANGNIKRMQQWGLKPGGSSQIDDLRYTYLDNGNKLKNVLDFYNDEQTRLGDFRTPASHPQKTQKKNYIDNPGSVDINTIEDYTYDDNGNLKKDLNKDLYNADGIVYNYMNQPELLTVRRPDGSIRGTITYTYDANGNKLRKVIVDGSISGKTVTTTTSYMGDMVYESRQTIPANTPNDDYTQQLQFIHHEEGRIRFIAQKGNAPARFEQDYYIKDHLGNIRMMLTEERQQDIYPAATLEGSMSTGGIPNAVFEEQKYYTINPGNIVDKVEATGIPQYRNKNGGDVATDPPVNNNPNSDATAFSQKLYKLQAAGSNGVTGLGITLKVMSGDYIDIYGKSYYFENNTSGTNYEVPVLDILSGLLGSPTGSAGGKGVTGPGLNNIPLIADAVDDFLDDPNRGSGTQPKAYINWILFDENFNYVKGNFSRVGNPGIRNHFEEDPVLRNIDITKNGYLYVYCSNESPVKVYFDNLQVIHTRGPVLEETHYYPYGLPMSGISSKAMGKTENKFKANSGSELVNELDLYTYETVFRSYDPQLGRFHQIDPLADDYMEESPYNYGYNNPVFWTDPLGADNISLEDILKQIEDGTIKPGHYYNTGDGTFEHQEIEGMRYDEEKQRLIIYFPQYVAYDAEGHEVKVSTRKPIIHDVPEKYRPLKESLIDYVPVIGDARAAIDDIRKGKWGWAIFHTVMAVSDVFLIKALVTAPAKAAIKQGVKGLKNYFGVGMSHNYGATVSRWKRLNLNTSGFKHHWMISQETIKKYPILKAIGNQQWNLKRFSSQAAHMRWGHGQVYGGKGYSFWKVAYPFMATPAWTKYLAVSTTMHLYE